MINIESAKSYCYEDLCLIENYQEAIADKKHTWVCHHRLGAMMNCGKDELVAKECYYDRPAHELMFVTRSEHNRIHNENRPSWSSSHRRAMPEEMKQRISKRLLGRHFSQETHEKKKKAMSGLLFWNNGKEQTRSRACPGEGWARGRLRGIIHFTKQKKQKIINRGNKKS